MKKENGITLISLVVTIIILIILAGVSINLILGQDGIINKTKEAKENIELAQVEEQQQLNELYEQMENSSSGISVGSIEKLVEFKKAIADYIESKNVGRPETTGDASVYINSFEEVLALASKVDESVAATEEDIAEGKQAWVNGKLITGKATTNNFNVNNLQTISAQSTSPYTFSSDGIAILGLNYTINSGAYKYVYFKINNEYLNGDPVKVYSVSNTLTYCIEVKSGDVLTWGQSQYAGLSMTGSVSLAKSYLIPKD